MKHKCLLLAPPYYGLDRSIARAFERNGVECIRLNTHLFPYYWERIVGRIMRLGPLKRLFQPLLKVPLGAENRRYRQVAERHRPSFIFSIKGETLFPETLSYFKTRLRMHCLSYQWDDPFHSFAGQQGVDHRRSNFAQGMNLYDHIFVFDRHYITVIREKGFSDVSYLPLATDEELYQSVSLTDHERTLYAHDVGFVGVPMANRIALFNSLDGFDVAVFGDSWNKYRNDIKGSYYKGKAAGITLPKIYAGSKINLNIHHPQSISGLNTRTFDIPACGAFEIVDHKTGLDELFAVGKEIVCYHHIDELKDLIAHYIKHPAERREIALRGSLNVRENHTWVHRVGDIMKIIGS